MGVKSDNSSVESIADRIGNLIVPDAKASTLVSDPPINQPPESEALLEQKAVNEDLVDQLNHGKKLRDEQFAQFRGLHSLRKSEFKNLRWLVVSWLSAVLIILIYTGFSAHKGDSKIVTFWGIKAEWTKSPSFVLSDPVLIALITTTTAGVISLFAIAAKWLFPSREEKLIAAAAVGKEPLWEAGEGAGSSHDKSRTKSRNGKSPKSPPT